MILKHVHSIVIIVFIVAFLFSSISCKANIENEREEAFLKMIQRYTEEIEEDPKDFIAYYSRCGAYYRLKMYAKAMDDCLSAIKLKPEFSDPYYSIGLIHLNKNNNKDALLWINKAIAIDGESFTYVFHRAVAYDNLKKTQLAIADYTKIINSKPVPEPDEKDERKRALGLYGNYYYSLKRRAVLYNSSEKYEEALKDIHEALRYYRDDAEIYSVRGWTYQGLKKLDEALSDYEKSIKMNPESPFSYTGISHVYAIRKDKEKALEYLVKSMEKGLYHRDYYHNMKELVDVVGEEKINELFDRFSVK